jgi:hypothetical protein
MLLFETPAIVNNNTNIMDVIMMEMEEILRPFYPVSLFLFRYAGNKK